LGGKIIKTIKGKIKISSLNSQQCLQTSCQKCIGDITSHVCVSFRDVSDLFTTLFDLVLNILSNNTQICCRTGNQSNCPLSFSKNRYFTGNDKNSEKKASLPF